MTFSVDIKDRNLLALIDGIVGNGEVKVDHPVQLKEAELKEEYDNPKQEHYELHYHHMEQADKAEKKQDYHGRTADWHERRGASAGPNFLRDTHAKLHHSYRDIAKMHRELQHYHGKEHDKLEPQTEFHVTK